MTKISDLTNKTPVATDYVTGIDSEDANVQTQNKNFLFSAISTFVFGAKTTDDLAEGSTNLYASETNIANSAHIQGIESDITDLENDKEDVSNKKTDFTVVDNIGYATTQAIVNYIAALGFDVTGLSEETSIAEDDEIPFYDDDATSNKKITVSNFINSISGTYIEQFSKTTSGATFTHTITHGLGRVPKDIEVYILQDGTDYSHGHYNPTTQSSQGLRAGTTTVKSSAVGFTYEGVSDYFDVTVTSPTTTQFTLTFTENGSCSGGDDLEILIKAR